MVRVDQSEGQGNRQGNGIVTAYYNEFDPGAAAWLRELIRNGHIADGVVDERSILDVSASDLVGFTQCHFFAGIGGWSYALRLAGWPDDRPVWTGSPPCQPFSSAGARGGRDDERHLAPHFIDLVRACRPGMLFGEQVASAAVFGKVAKRSRGSVDVAPEWVWFDDLSDRLEAARYAVGASDIPAAGIGAPHIRQRTFFGAVRLADAVRGGQQGPGVVGRPCNPAPEVDREVDRVVDAGGDCGLADAGRAMLQSEQQLGSNGSAPTAIEGKAREQQRCGVSDRNSGASCGLAGPWRSFAEWFGVCWSDCDGPCTCWNREDAPDGYFWHDDEGWVDVIDFLRSPANISAELEPVRPGTPHSPWRDADWLFCRDGKWRPVEPGTFPLANGVSARVGRLRGYGNAIVPQAAAIFISEFEQCI